MADFALNTTNMNIGVLLSAFPSFGIKARNNLRLSASRAILNNPITLTLGLGLASG
jgi:hypothetical protein